MLSTVLQVLNKLVFVGRLSQWVIIALAFCISIVGSLILAKFLNVNIIKRAMRFWGNKSLNNSIWRDIVDFDQGTKILVSIIGSTYGYLGFLLEMEEKGSESWFALTDWVKVKMDDNNEVAGTFNQVNHPELKSSIVLRLSDVKSMMLFYDKNTKVYLGK